MGGDAIKGFVFFTVWLFSLALKNIQVNFKFLACLLVPLMYRKQYNVCILIYIKELYALLDIKNSFRLINPTSSVFFCF